MREPGESAPNISPACFAPRVWLTKTEVFAACQALADADRALARAGRGPEAEALGDLFELFEDRLSGGLSVRARPGSGPRPCPGSSQAAPTR